MVLARAACSFSFVVKQSRQRHPVVTWSGTCFRDPLRYADKAHWGSTTRMVVIETSDRASIADAGRGGLFALRRIEGGDGSIRVAHKTVLDASRVRVGARDVSSLVDADPMRS